MPKEHEVCGSDLVAPMLAFSIMAQVAVERLFDRPGPAPRALAALARVGGAIELFVYANAIPTRRSDGRYGPGYEIQRLRFDPGADRRPTRGGGGRVARDPTGGARGCR